MSSGVIPPTYICHDCRRVVFGADARFYEGMHFHDYCLPPYLAKQEAGYEKKVRLGKITLAENIEYIDIRGVNEKVRSDPGEPGLEKTFFPDLPKFKGNTRLSVESIRQKSIRSTTEWKRLGIPRGEYAQLCAQRKEVMLQKYQARTIPKNILLSESAGNISACVVCGRRTYCFEDKCHECSGKNEQKYITCGEEL